MTPKKSPPAKKPAAKKATVTPAKAKAPAKPAKKAATTPAKAAKAPTKKAEASKTKPTAKPAPKIAKKAAPVKAAPAKAVAAKAAPAEKPAGAPKASAAPAPPKGKGSAVKKLLAKKPVKPARPTAPPPPKPLTNKEKLAKLLSLRAADAKNKSREAAEELRKGSGSAVPSSVHKAAEFAETRKISSILKSGKRSVREEAPAAAPKKIKKRKLPYSKAELRELKDILESERTRLLRDLAVMNDVAASSEENMSRSFSNHQADAATDSSALETTFVTRRYEEERLSQVTRALERLEAGTYGLCEMCAEEPLKNCESCPFIPIGRLRAKPFAILCLPCRQDLEKRNRR